MNVREAIGIAIEILTSPSAHRAAEDSRFVLSPSPRLDCEILLAETLALSRSSLSAHPELELGDREQRFFDSVRRRAQGLPVAYITGFKEFWGHRFHVTPDVLIPKPDTETLIERAEDILREIEAARRSESNQGTSRELDSPREPDSRRELDSPREPASSRELDSPREPAPIRVLDVCTGSGCIAISLKLDFPGISMTATDISPQALAVARDNASALLPANANPIRFVLGDLREGLPPAHAYDLIVSNPPYVPSKTARELLDDGRNEPLLALDGGADGLDLVRALVDNVLASLAPGGRFLVETGEYNAGAAAAYMSERGFANVTIHRDLAGQDRVIEGTHK